MTSFKKRILRLQSGKEIKLYGNSIAIGASLEIGEGAPPNIFFSLGKSTEEKASPEREPGNPYDLSADDLLEIADYNMRLWMNFKDKIRKHGVSDARVFERES